MMQRWCRAFTTTRAPQRARRSLPVKRPMRTLLGTGHIVVGLLLLPGWLIVDLDDSWSLVPDQVPDALLLAVDRGVGAWELPGVGVVLILAWLGAAAGLGLALRTKRSGWLLVSGLLSTVAGFSGWRRSASSSSLPWRLDCWCPRTGTHSTPMCGLAGRPTPSWSGAVPTPSPLWSCGSGERLVSPPTARRSA